MWNTVARRDAHEVEVRDVGARERDPDRLAALDADAVVPAEEEGGDSSRWTRYSYRQFTILQSQHNAPEIEVRHKCPTLQQRFVTFREALRRRFASHLAVEEREPTARSR